MLDHGFSLRNLLEASAWALFAVALVAWTVFKSVAIAEGGIVVLTLACTLSILNDNARTRSLAWLAMHAGDPEERPVSQLRSPK